MFKNLTIYTIADNFSVDMEAALVAAATAIYGACGPTQTDACGWAPPREENGALIESIGGQWIMRFVTE